MLREERSSRLSLAGLLCIALLLGHGQDARAKGFLQPQPLAVAVLPALDRVVTLDNWYEISDPVQGVDNLHTLRETTGASWPASRWEGWAWR